MFNPFTRISFSSQYLSSVQTPDKSDTRAFLRWVRSQGPSPHASGIAKNTFGPVGIPPQAPGNKPNPRRRQKPGRTPHPPEAGAKSPVPRPTRVTECDPTTGEVSRKGKRPLISFSSQSLRRTQIINVHIRNFKEK